MNAHSQEYLKVFSKVSTEIHSGTNMEEILDCLLVNISKLLKLKGCLIWVVENNRNKITSMMSQEDQYSGLTEIDFPHLQELILNELEGPVCGADLHKDKCLNGIINNGKNALSAISFDIVGHFKGILAIYYDESSSPSAQEMELLTCLGEQSGLALKKVIHCDYKRVETLKLMVEGFTLALEAKDERTHGHSVQVAEYAKLVATELRLTKGEVETIYHGGLLHDIGKIGMNDHILERLGILSRKEMDMVKKHPIIGAKITRPLKFLCDVEPLILHHHERYDGTGYPDGLKGEAIPLGARILTVCDAFETMLAGRNHFAKMKFEDAIYHLKKGAERQFDPKVIRALFSAIERKPEMVNSTMANLRSLRMHKEVLKNGVASIPALFI